ncbi:uncharacterized protein BYT42DRAFT_574504 [Radiomyces spectabilis]|uniref:uncharacterized protein n=1 Tax=Radiomyces spectabilis TaxID=64574 RepID=UPI002220B310|nr:uncharacterized protein BYT42DRAFT_574504 [Radiomyces spectabilis]KAI8376415.1 hypothetical protein BYT42DRAFT_574504 [Radiomyces spectabilis]
MESDLSLSGTSSAIDSGVADQRPFAPASPTYSSSPPPSHYHSQFDTASLHQEADISDSPTWNNSLRKQASSSFLAPTPSRPLFSTSQPDLLEDTVSAIAPLPASASPSQRTYGAPLARPTSASSAPARPSRHRTSDVDITENQKDTMLKLDPEELKRFRKWIVGFCVVNFDLEIGQAMDYVYPPMELTEAEQKNVCFSAFPDSNVFEVGDQVYNIRVRATSSEFAVSGPTTNAGFLYGYVFFRQKKDPTIRRGYFQKSLVLLSQHPFVGLFSRIVALLGPAFFDTGQPMLEAACMNICSWDPPEEGQMLDLPFLGRLLQVDLPQSLQPQLLETSPFDMNRHQPDLQIMASLPVGALYHHFKDILKDLWLLWELVLLGEPIVVMAPDPGVCSEAVICLVDLIAPIPYCGDYRPYFTIQDSDFKSFVTKNKPPCNLILGVTNPFFNTAIEHWPHIVRVGRQQLRKPDGTLITAHNNHMHSSRKSKAGLGSRSNIIFDFVQGVTSKRKSVLSKDREILRMLTEAAVRGHPPDWLLNNILRRHFLDLTEKFLAPLDRYFNELIPNKSIVHSTTYPRRLRPFRTDEFLKSLKEHGAPLPFKSTFKTRTSTVDPIKEFYSQFLKCGNFATWLQQRMTEAEKTITHCD